MNKYLHIQKEPKFLSHVIHYIGTVTSRFRFFLVALASGNFGRSNLFD
jgi:hypothetical protein